MSYCANKFGFQERSHYSLVVNDDSNFSEFLPTHVKCLHWFDSYLLFHFIGVGSTKIFLGTINLIPNQST